MKQVRLWFLMGLLTVGAIAAAVTPPTDLSLRGIVDWIGVGGHIASGTSLPSVAPVGTRFTRLNAPTKPVEYRSTGSAWYPMWTWNHRDLTNLSYEISGHGIVPPSFGGTGGANASEARFYLDVFSKASTTALIPLNASFTFDGLSSDVSHIDFATTLPPPAYQYGRMFWDGDNSCPAFYPDTSNAILQIGQEMWVKVKNSEVATMTNGTVVYLSSPFTGKEVPARLALADAASTSAIIGVVTHDIAPDGSGFATVLGLVRDLNTAAFTEGSKVFLSATTPGSFTATAPAAPNCSVIVGYVLKSHANAGVIYVRVWLNGSLERATFAETVHFAKQVTFATAPVFTDAPGSRLAIGFPNPAGKSNYVLAVGTDTSTLYWSPVGGGDGGVSDHSLLTNLDYGFAGHTGFAAASDLASYQPTASMSVYALDASLTAAIGQIPNNASFSFDLLSDSPDYTGNGGKVLALNGGGTALEWVSVPGIGSLSHAGLSDLDFESSGHTGFTGATETASITSTLQAVIASVSAELDPANYQENYDVMASTSTLISPLSGRTYVGIQNIDDLKSVHIYPNGLVASSGPANLVLYAGEVWYQRLADSVPVAFYASEATPIVVFQGK